MRSFLTMLGIIIGIAAIISIVSTIKGTNERLRMMEYGGRPLMYLYSKFGEKKNWMGDIDLTFETDEELDRCVRALKAAEREFDMLQYLQYEFMDNHEKLGDGVYRTTYSDGTQVIVDYNRGSYEVACAAP